MLFVRYYFFIFFCISLLSNEIVWGRGARFRPHGAVQKSVAQTSDLWIISKIIFKGPLKRKERYQQCYVLEPGQPFDASVHEKSLQEMRTLLEQGGYLNNEVKASFFYQEKTKKVDVILTISPGELFVFHDFDLQFIHFSVSDFSFAEKQSLRQACRAMLASMLKRNYYEKKMADLCLNALKDVCHQKGFFNVVFNYDIVSDKKRHELKVFFKLDFTKAERYLFFGNIFFTGTDLFKSIAPFNVPLCVISSETVVEDIVQLYRDRGFLTCAVSIKKEKRACRFVIHEGLRFKIARVEIKGSRWAEKIVADYFSLLTRQEYYNADLLQRCFDDLKNYYAEQGFWDFLIEGHELSSGSNPDEKVLSVAVHEGEQKFLKYVVVEQFPDIMFERPFVLYKFPGTPVPFDKKIMQKQHDWLASYLQDHGYLYSSFEPCLETLSADANVVAVTWRLTGFGKPVEFGKTVITGNSSISELLLLKGLAYKEGEIWNVRALDKSLDRLKSLAVFKSVSLRPADFFVPEPSKKMILKVIEDDPYELCIHAGLGFLSKNFDARGQGITYRFGGGFLCRNPAHRGDVLRIDGDLTRYMRSGALDYTIPRWASIPMIFGASIYGEHRDQPFFIGSPDILYKFLRVGSAFRFSGAYEHINWNIKSNIEWLKIEGLSLQGARVLQFEPTLLDRFFPYFVVEPTFSFDYLDDPVLTRRGFFVAASLKGMFPITLKDAWILKMVLEQSFFYPMASWLVVALRLRLGTIVNVDFERIMPPERFYLGGADSLRGYSPDFAPPLNRYIDLGQTERWVPVGGKSMFNMNAELRFPFYGNLGGALFTDIGFLSRHGITSIVSEKLLGSSGFGLRYASPVGIFRFDMGWKWEKHFIEDRAFAWFLSLGNVF